MILGTGIDLIEVARVQGAVERFGDRFLAKVLLPAEIEYCRGFSQPGPHIAARFAAKEAVSKAFGTGIGGDLSWQDIEVARHPSGQPHIRLHGKALALLASRGGRVVHLSLTHTQGHAAAVAVLEG